MQFLEGVESQPNNNSSELEGRVNQLGRYTNIRSTFPYGVVSKFYL